MEKKIITSAQLGILILEFIYIYIILLTCTLNKFSCVIYWNGFLCLYEPRKISSWELERKKPRFAIQIQIFVCIINIKRKTSHGRAYNEHPRADPQRHSPNEWLERQHQSYERRAAAPHETAYQPRKWTRRARQRSWTCKFFWISLLLF